MNDLPQRKHPRIKQYDYSTSGAYFITICSQNRVNLFSEINDSLVLTEYGRIVEKQLQSISDRYPFAKIDASVIMPNHIHFILVLKCDTIEQGHGQRPSVSDIVCSFKSITTRECKQAGYTDKVFQTSFYDHIIRTKEDYDGVLQYIINNPLQWHLDELYHGQ